MHISRERDKIYNTIANPLNLLQHVSFGDEGKLSLPDIKYINTIRYRVYESAAFQTELYDVSQD